MEQKNNTWANPTPAGLVALAVACFGFFALLSGKVTKEALPLLGCWLLGGFVVQIVVAILDLKSNNTAGGNTFLYFSAFFMLTSGLECFLKAKGGVDVRMDGWAWLALSSVVTLWTPAFFKSPKILLGIVLILNVAVWSIAFIDLGIVARTFSYIPAYALLACGILGIYLSSAMVVNTTFGKDIYPNP